MSCVAAELWKALNEESRKCLNWSYWKNEIPRNTIDSISIKMPNNAIDRKRLVVLIFYLLLIYKQPNRVAYVSVHGFLLGPKSC